MSKILLFFLAVHTKNTCQEPNSRQAVFFIEIRSIAKGDAHTAGKLHHLMVLWHQLGFAGHLRQGVLGHNAANLRHRHAVPFLFDELGGLYTCLLYTSRCV